MANFKYTKQTDFATQHFSAKLKPSVNEFILLIILLLPSFTAFSEKKNLYSTQVLVKENQRDNPEYQKLAFAQILSNLSGQKVADILRKPFLNDFDIQKGIKRSYLQRVPNTIQSSHTSEFKYWYNSVMNEKFVDSALMNGQLDLWPKHRPTMTLWLAIETQNGSLEISENPKYKYWLENWAKGHGVTINILSPNQTLNTKISPQMVKNMSHNLVKHSKQHFGASYVAAVFIQERSDQLKGRFGLSINQSDFKFKHINEDKDNVSSLTYQIISGLSHFQASQQKINNIDVQQQTVQIVVNDLKNYQDSLDLNNYLKTLSFMTQFEIIRAKADSQTFRANVKINKSALANMLTRSGRLQAVNNNSIHQMVFNWK